MTRDDLIAAYAAPNCHYHNLAHIEDCLDKLAQVHNLLAAERLAKAEGATHHF